MTLDADESRYLSEDCAQLIKNSLRKDRGFVRVLIGQTTGISEGSTLHVLKSGYNNWV